MLKKVVCIENKDSRYWLTVGKVYEVKSETDRNYMVENDRGYDYPYNKELFKDETIVIALNEHENDAIKYALGVTVEHLKGEARTAIHENNFSGAIGFLEQAKLTLELFSKIQ